ncbi:hypothetical protein J7E83_05940 [Arthrobacter sp. ISL-48]|uniref:hypothetical protein n=1 Tax=Arthrobacter sp. ISL-48 TaxID=2819110 RepID=UPI001BE5B33A|nr:hypothetical protein [Arthrobacter sp. ISL-48]MBT2531669.1 hypothetical protein [Arthrobacter sp. ISL-48]
MTKVIDASSPRRIGPQETRTASPAVIKGTKVLLWAVAAVALGLLAWGRLPLLARRTVWAENGGVFLRDVLANGDLMSIPLSYDGYLHVIPRMLASLAHAVVPLQGYALAMSLLTCLAVGAISVAVVHLSRSVTEAVPVRLMIAAIPVLLPIGPHEVLGNAANLHWYLLWLMPWLLLYKPKSRAAAGGMFLAAFLTAASEIITGMFLPLAVWAAFRRRNFAAPAGLALGVVLQVLTTLTKPRFSGAAPSDAVDIPSVLLGFGLLPIGSIWHADSRTLASNIISFGGWALFIPCLLVVALLAYVLVAGGRGLKLTALGALGASVLCWVASVVLSGSTIFNYAHYTATDWATEFVYIRYAAAPAMFLLLLVPLAAAVALTRGHVNQRTAFAVAGMFVAFLLASYLPASTVRDAGPSWSAGVSEARAACEADPSLPTAAVLVAPVAWKFDQVQIPCSELRSS